MGMFMYVFFIHVGCYDAYPRHTCSVHMFLTHGMSDCTTACVVQASMSWLAFREELFFVVFFEKMHE